MDTSFIMDMFRYKVDMSEIFDLMPRASLATVPQVVHELNALAKKKSTHSRYARVALEMLGKIEVVNAPKESADDALAILAGGENVVATNDEKLRKRIAKKRLKTIYLRGRKHLAIS